MLSRRSLAIAGALLAVAGILVWLFGSTLDRPIGAMLHLDREYRDLSRIVFLTELGGAAVMIPFALACAVWLAVRRNGRVAAWLVLTIASGRLLVELLKALIGRERPDVAGQLMHVTSASFPSSHSAGSMLTIVALLLAFRLPPRVALLVLAWPVSIGFTRVLLGVHWPSDVLAGWGFGLLWPALAAAWLPARRSR